jgi:hypothetical protein
MCSEEVGCFEACSWIVDDSMRVEQIPTNKQANGINMYEPSFRFLSF